MRNISIKGLSLVLILLTFGFIPLSAQDSLDAVYSQLNLAFAEHSADKISAVLKNQSGSPDYSLYEAYALKKTRQLIIDDDLEFARQASLAVIDNNLENFDAVDLYSYIDRAILNEQAAKQAEENRARLEAERIAAMNARTKEKIEKSNTYSTVSTASGSSVYINESHRQFSSLTWNFQFGIADVLLQNVSDPASYSSIKYGLLLGLDLLYQTDQYTMGLDVQGDYHMLTMGKGEEEVMYSLRAIPMISFNSISNKVFLRAGFAYYGLGSDGKVETGSVESFPTPVIGIGLDNIKFGETGLQLHYDYCLGHFSMEDVKASMEFGGAVTVPLAINERTKIGVKLGVSDLLFMKQNGIDNRAKAIFAIGVGNVNK
ncbi:MAG: hypothetical protein IJL34_10690 [Treponema sp.]|nr:hypothetical protein [Treponema sp.]